MNSPFLFNARFAAALLLVAAAALISIAGLDTEMTALGVLASGALAVALAATRREPAPVPVPDVAADPPVRPAAAELPEFLETLGEPIMIAVRGKVVNANLAARALLGDHIIGEDVRTAIRHPAVSEQLAGMRPDRPVESIELVGIGTRDQRWEMRVAPFAGDRNVIQLIDRSRSHAAERMRVDFVANASHELRTPLSAVLGFVETLSEENETGDAETRARFLKVIFDEARRMQQLVDDLISLSRIEADKHRAPDDRVDLATLAAEVKAVMEDNRRARGRPLSLEIAADVPPVAGDRAQLSQVLHNLIVNALKYGRPDTPVRIRIGRAGGNMVALHVIDQGEGIPPEHLPRVTERFYRVDPGRSRALGGTGLGLAIVKHIVERHRGRMEIDSKVGEGTRVTVQLPAQAQPRPETPPAGEAPGAESPKSHETATLATNSLANSA